MVDKRNGGLYEEWWLIWRNLTAQGRRLERGVYPTINHAAAAVKFQGESDSFKEEMMDFFAKKLGDCRVYAVTAWRQDYGENSIAVLGDDGKVDIISCLPEDLERGGIRELRLARYRTMRAVEKIAPATLAQIVVPDRKQIELWGSRTESVQ